MLSLSSLTSPRKNLNMLWGAGGGGEKKKKGIKGRGGRGEGGGGGGGRGGEKKKKDISGRREMSISIWCLNHVQTIRMR